MRARKVKHNSQQSASPSNAPFSGVVQGYASDPLGNAGTEQLDNQYPSVQTLNAGQIFDQSRPTPPGTVQAYPDDGSDAWSTSPTGYGSGQSLAPSPPAAPYRPPTFTSYDHWQTGMDVHSLGKGKAIEVDHPGVMTSSGSQVIFAQYHQIDPSSDVSFMDNLGLGLVSPSNTSSGFSADPYQYPQQVVLEDDPVNHLDLGAQTNKFVDQFEYASQKNWTHDGRDGDQDKSRRPQAGKQKQKKSSNKKE